MRLALLLTIQLAGCESRYGTYIDVNGGSRAIGFDRVELYFGSATELAALRTPSRLGTGKVFARHYDASDRVDIVRRGDGSLAHETTFYVPFDDSNRKLGDYVLALASAGDQPTGVGELAGFTVEDRVVAAFDIELEPYVAGDVETWGDAPSCVAWTKHRDPDPPDTASTYAVVNDDDRDCDGLIASLDCDDAAHCPDPTTCGPSAACGAQDACALGCRGQDSCAPRICMYAGFCDPQCEDPDLEGRHACAIQLEPLHVEALVPSTANRICTPSLKFRPYGLDCRDARLEYADAGPHTISVSDDGSSCIIDVSPATQTLLGATYHLAISFAGPAFPLRWSFVLGLTPVSVASCDQIAMPAIDMLGEPADCR